MEPTIFTDVEDDMFIAIEESFGPIMIISIFENGLVQIPTSVMIAMCVCLYVFVCVHN